VLGFFDPAEKKRGKKKIRWTLPQRKKGGGPTPFMKKRPREKTHPLGEISFFLGEGKREREHERRKLSSS